jgi:hypothetical protein
MVVFEKIEKYFKENPRYIGFFIIAMGIFMILTAIKNWEWVFGGIGMNLKKIQGIGNFFGRGIARVVAGIFGTFCVIFGIFWFFAYSKN